MRRFNRFYTRQIGLLEEGLLRSPFSLTEARVVYELAHHEETTATHLAQELGLDAGYLSRILAAFQKQGLVRKRSSPTDGRVQLLSLTEGGQEAFAGINAASRREIESMLGELTDGEQRLLLRAMADIEEGWIAEKDGVNVGSVFLVDEPEREGVARLRLLLVEPEVRGLGIGRRLVQECTRFARQAGYSAITLWTNDVLVSARRIYEAEGYRLVREEPHHSFGADLVSQDWELAL